MECKVAWKGNENFVYRSGGLIFNALKLQTDPSTSTTDTHVLYKSGLDRFRMKNYK